MADPDPVVIVENIIRIAIRIANAVETVRENKEECREIEKLVRRVSDVLSLLKESEMMRHLVVSRALEDLVDAIERALDVVTACQGRNMMCLFCNPGKMGKKLRQVKNDISQRIVLVIFASHTVATFIVATEGQQSAVTVNVFPVRTHQPPPMSEHRPSRSTAFVEDLQPTHEAPSPSPDALLSNGVLPSRPAQERPYAPVIIAGVSNLEPHSQTHLSATPPPSHPLPTYVTSPISKQQPHRSSTQPSPPRRSPIANIAPPLSKHQSPSPARSSLPQPSRPTPTNPMANIGPTKSGHLPGPSSGVLPRSASQNTTEVLEPISGPVSFTSSTEDVWLVIYHKAFFNKYRTQLHLASKLHTKDMDVLRINKYIIRVLGYGHEFIWENDCLETHIFLVEEYLPNGSMGNNIYGEYRLHWSSLFSIIQGLAQGLNWLHEQNIIHRNVKPPNVLLDSHMNPKITDFGIAKILEKPVIHDKNIAGTVGYMPPEYILEGTLSTKYDVYSFGVTLLETISGMCRSECARHHASIPWAWNVRDNQQMGELFEPSLFEESQLMEIKRCLEIGLLCTQFEWAERPEVLDMLNGKKIRVRTPKQPEYTKARVVASKGASHGHKVRSGR